MLQKNKPLCRDFERQSYHSAVRPYQSAQVASRCRGVRLEFGRGPGRVLPRCAAPERSRRLAGHGPHGAFMAGMALKPSWAARGARNAPRGPDGHCRRRVNWAPPAKEHR